MTYMAPYNPRYNYTFLWEKPCVQPPQLQVSNKNTLLDAIDAHPKLKKMSHLIRKAGLTTLFDDRRAELSAFLPIDDSVSDDVLKYDRLCARIFLQSSVLRVKIPTNRLNTNRMCMYETGDKANEMIIECVRGKIISNGSEVIETHDKQNGMLYIVDGTYVPTFL